VIDLPATVDPDSAKAGLSDGVVTVRIPKRPEVKPRQVPLSLAGTGGKPRGK
jgi:HSP20 family molecular chaperone IbpA